MIKKLIYFIFIIGVNFGISQQKYPKWEKGVLEIHHINTGRGDAAFCIFPDGTTMIIDAGDTSDTHIRTLSPRNATRLPNNKRTSPQWIIDYIKQFHPNKNQPFIDYALITHYHDDHFGEVDSLRKKSKKGDYLLTGITELGDSLLIHKVIDRGYDFPIQLKDIKIQQQFKNDEYKIIPTLKNYWAFLDAQKELGTIHESLVAGKKDQIHLKEDANSYKDFSIRNIAVNGKIWTGEKENFYELYREGNYPGENNLSTAIKISFGLFDYFTGGDISGIDAMGATDFNSIESHIAPVVGPVDVATLNHHGNRDSQNAYYIRSIRPRVWIQQNWSSDHPGDEVLRRLLNKNIYPGNRDIFSTVMLASNKYVIGSNLNEYKSQEGHIVIRVIKGGKQYHVYVLNDKTEQREVLHKFGPYESR